MAGRMLSDLEGCYDVWEDAMTSGKTPSHLEECDGIWEDAKVSTYKLLKKINTTTKKKIIIRPKPSLSTALSAAAGACPARWWDPGALEAASGTGTPPGGRGAASSRGLRHPLVAAGGFAKPHQQRQTLREISPGAIAACPFRGPAAPRLRCSERDRTALGESPIATEGTGKRARTGGLCPWHPGARPYATGSEPPACGKRQITARSSPDNSLSPKSAPGPLPR